MGSIMKKLIIIVGIFFSISIFAQNPNLGTSGAQFLELHVGARATAMGGAFVGLADDITSVFWNPAGLASLKSNAAHFSYMRWFDLFDFNALAAAVNLGDIGTFGASIVVFSMDKMEITTEYKPNGTGTYYDAQDIAVGLTYARYFTDRFRFGLTAKYVSQRIWHETADGLAFDVGTQYTLDFNNLTIAMRMSNFGGDLQFDGEDLDVIYDKNSDLPQNRLTPSRLKTETYPLPLTFQVGIGIDIVRDDIATIRLGIDAVHPNDNDERINIGTEFAFYDRLFFRCGYKYNYDDEDFTMGAGINLPISTYKISFDYAFSDYSVLSTVHRISIGLEF